MIGRLILTLTCRGFIAGLDSQTCAADCLAHTDLPSISLSQADQRTSQPASQPSTQPSISQPSAYCPPATPTCAIASHPWPYAPPSVLPPSRLYCLHALHLQSCVTKECHKLDCAGRQGTARQGGGTQRGTWKPRPCHSLHHSGSRLPPAVCVAAAVWQWCTGWCGWPGCGAECSEAQPW